MNLNTIYEVASGYGLYDNNLDVIYDFKNIYTGGLVFNDKYPTGEQFNYNNRQIFLDKNPGLSITKSTFVNDDFFDFDPTKYIQVLGLSGLQNWTVFLKYKISGCESPNFNKNRILLFNKTDFNTTSGVCLSLDDGNKFVMEYKDKFHNTFIESNKECLFSLERNDTFLNFEVYYPNAFDVKRSYIQHNDPYVLNDWYIGGFGKYNEIYTGFGPSGNVEIDAFLLFDKSLDSNQKLDLAQAILSSGRVLSSGFTYTTNIFISGDNLVTGAIVGSGITGFQYVVKGTVTGINGSVFNIFEQSGISGFITGEIISGRRFVFTGISTGVTFFNQYIYSGNLENFYENNILITPNNKLSNLDDLDFIEIYGLNKTGQGYPYNIYYDPVLNSYRMLNYPIDKNTFFFLNGLLQNSGDLNSGYFQITGSNIISNILDVNDYGEYKFYTGIVGFVSGISGSQNYMTDVTLNDKNYASNDLYLNGQKLIEKINYTKTSYLINALNGNQINSTIPYAVPYNNLIDIDSAGGGVFAYRVIGLTKSGSLISSNYGGGGEGLVAPNVTGVKQISVAASHDLILLSNNTISGYGQGGAGGTLYPVTGINGSALTLTGVQKIAVGANFSLALLNNGTITGWGRNNSNQLNIPTNITDYIDVAASSSTSWGLRANGSITGWGYSAFNLLTAGSHLTGIKQIAGGADYVLVLLNDNTVTGWGQRIYYQTTGINGSALTLKNVKRIFAKGATNFSIALFEDNTITGWGADQAGSPISNYPLSNYKNVIDVGLGDSSISLLLEGTGVNLLKENISDGELAFYPKINNQYYITGTDLNTFKNISGLAEEYVWLNGVKMDKNYDYQKISCLSLKNTDKFTSKQTGLIWDTDILGFYSL